MNATRAVVVLLLVLIVFGFVVQAVRGPAGASPSAAATPTPAATPSRADARAVVGAVAAVQRAFNAGNVRRLCRPGALLDPAVVRQQNRLPGGCRSELEGLVANKSPLRLTVRRLDLRPDLATAEVSTQRGVDAAVDLVRDGSRWLMSFSGGDDPMTVLAGTG